MNLPKIFLVVLTAPAATYGAAQSNDSAHLPLQVPAKTLAVPTDVSPAMQNLIGAPRNPIWNQLWKSGEEWRTAANAQAAQAVQTLPAMRQRLHVSARDGPEQQQLEELVVRQGVGARFQKAFAQPVAMAGMARPFFSLVPGGVADHPGKFG